MKYMHFTLALFLISSTAFSFETGIYHGESADHKQICDANIKQNTKSITINKFICTNSKNGIESNWNPEELSFGHFQTGSPTNGIGTSTDISANAIVYIMANDPSVNIIIESLSSSANGIIHYNFKGTFQKVEEIFMDVDLIKQ
jgi:hypothetical protein